MLAGIPGAGLGGDAHFAKRTGRFVELTILDERMLPVGVKARL